jgi:hypothetical protein
VVACTGHPRVAAGGFLGEEVVPIPVHRRWGRRARRWAGGGGAGRWSRRRRRWDVGRQRWWLEERRVAVLGRPRGGGTADPLRRWWSPWWWRRPGFSPRDANR